MAFHRAHRKFGREKNQRVALMKSLAYALTLEEKIKTTEAKAKELRPMIEKLITLGKKETPASRRLLEARVGKIAARKIASTLSPRYKGRAGGYTRITKLVRRASDGAPQAVIEFV
ncbi:50S ribosomal protein L17 [Candidatus Parcubacteria bacterium]|nr:50S ribosomal protein L17 [Candidatus Parcubacteria bacterium]